MPYILELANVKPEQTQLGERLVKMWTTRESGSQHGLKSHSSISIHASVWLDIPVRY